MNAQDTRKRSIDWLMRLAQMASMPVSRRRFTQFDRRADSHPELLCSLIARQSAALHRGNHALAKIIGIRLAHPCWPLSRPTW